MLRKEWRELTAEIARLQAILADKALIDALIAEELEQMASEFKSPRQTADALRFIIPFCWANVNSFAAQKLVLPSKNRKCGKPVIKLGRKVHCFGRATKA